MWRRKLLKSNVIFINIHYLKHGERKLHRAKKTYGMGVLHVIW